MPVGTYSCGSLVNQVATLPVFVSMFRSNWDNGSCLVFGVFNITAFTTVAIAYLLSPNGPFCESRSSDSLHAKLQFDVTQESQHPAPWVQSSLYSSPAQVRTNSDVSCANPPNISKVNRFDLFHTKPEGLIAAQESKTTLQPIVPYGHPLLSRISLVSIHNVFVTLATLILR